MSIHLGFVYRNDDYSPSPAFVHYCNMNLMSQMDYLRNLVSLAQKNRKIKLRQPLASAKLIIRQPLIFTSKEFVKTFLEELNIKKMVVLDIRCFSKSPDNPTERDFIGFDTNITPELLAEYEVAQAERDRIRANQQAEKLAKQNKALT